MSEPLTAMNERAHYVLHRRSELDPREVESARREVVEVHCRWGTETLLVKHLGERERFVLSCDPEDRAADLFVQGSDLGGDSKSWVCIQHARSGWVLRLPPSVRGSLRELALCEGELVAFWVGAIEVRVRRVAEGRGAARSKRRDRALWGAFFASAVIGATALSVSSVVYDEWREAAANNVLLDSTADDRERMIARFIERRGGPTVVGEHAAGAAGQRDESAPGAVAPVGNRGRTRRGREVVGTGGARATGRSAPVVAATGVFAALGAARASVNPFDGLREQGADVLGARGESAMGQTLAAAFGYGGLGGGVESQGASDESVSACGCGSSIMHGVQNWFYGEVLPDRPIERAARAASAASAALRDRGSRGVRLRVCGRDVSDESGGCAPTVSGDYSREIVRRAVRRNMGQIEHCYEQALAIDAGVRGRVAVRFVMGGDGVVIASGVESNDTESRALGSCVANAFRRMVFAAPPSGTVVTVTYPVTFSVAE
jgi:TonB family protein